MKKKNGFTLVELLAVIVVLALIMIIAIPSVLTVMNNARKQSFALYINKVVTAVQNQYVMDSSTGNIPGRGFYAYDITEDLDMKTIGSYVGYVIIDAFDVDEPNYYIFMHDSNYMIYNYNITKSKMPDADNAAIQTYDSTSFNEYFGTTKKGCDTVRNLYKDTTIKDVEGNDVSYSAPECKNPDGFIIVESAE